MAALADPGDDHREAAEAGSCHGLVEMGENCGLVVVPGTVLVGFLGNDDDEGPAVGLCLEPHRETGSKGQSGIGATLFASVKEEQHAERLVLGWSVDQAGQGIGRTGSKGHEGVPERGLAGPCYPRFRSGKGSRWLGRDPAE